MQNKSGVEWFWRLIQNGEKRDNHTASEESTERRWQAAQKGTFIRRKDVGG
jgi:hypothetical protein